MTTDNASPTDQARELLHQLGSQDLPYEQAIVKASMAQTFATLGQLAAAEKLTDLQSRLLDTIPASKPTPPSPHKTANPPALGEPARANCGAPGRSLGGALVLYVSAQDNDMYIDALDSDGEPIDLSVPLPSDEAVIAANAGLRYMARGDA